MTLQNGNEKSTETDIKKFVDEAMEEVNKEMAAFKEKWLKDMYAEAIQSRYVDFLKDGLEPCDFGNCGFRFDYVLAELPRDGMEEFVTKLGARDWNSLFPQDAPPAAPKPTPSPKTVAKLPAK